MAEAKTEAYRMKRSTDYGRMMAISQIIFGLGLKTKVFGGENNWLMEIMAKMVRPKIPQIPQNLIDRFF
jgi:hypothetical protein